MSTPSNGPTDAAVEPRAGAPAPMPPVRPLYWSVRRELWENRSIYVAPLVVAAVSILGSSIRALGLPHRMRTLSALDPAKQHSALVMPYSLAASLIVLTAYVVGAVYCLEALHGERRDRSILFWKSLPVSDLTTVLSKAAIPVVALPLIAFMLSLATQLAMLAQGTAVLLLTGAGVARLWAELPLFQMTCVMAYGLVVHALWHAPLYAWLLLVSAWARRVPLLWALLPPLAIGVLERFVLQTPHFASLVKYRFIGSIAVAFALEGRKGEHVERLSQLDPLRFLGTPGLWIGLIAAAVFLAAAARLRRNRDPI